jgi:hypothetical protein
MRRHDRQLERELARIPADQRQGPVFKGNIITWVHIITSAAGVGADSTWSMWGMMSTFSLSDEQTLRRVLRAHSVDGA